MRLTGELVRRLEGHLAAAVESLLTASLQVPGNPEGYALFREGPVLATLSTNPRAGWATQTYGLTGQPADVSLPLPVEPESSVDIREVTTIAEMDAHIDIQLGAYGVPPPVIDLLRPLRRTWHGTWARSCAARA